MSKFDSIDKLEEYISKLESKKQEDKLVIAFCSSSGCVANKSNEIRVKFEELIKACKKEDDD